MKTNMILLSYSLHFFHPPSHRLPTEPGENARSRRERCLQKKARVFERTTPLIFCPLKRVYNANYFSRLSRLLTCGCCDVGG